MAQARFVLKEPKSVSATLVYLFYNFNNQRLKYSTGEKVQPKYWNATKQRAKEVKDFREYYELNARLDNIEAAANNAYRKLKNDKVLPSPENLKMEIEVLLEISKPIEKITFVLFIKAYIEEVKGTKKPATISVYHTTLKHLEEFSISKKMPIDFEDITLEFYNLFTKYLSTEKGYLNNTTGKYIRVLKVFLNEASERGINKTLDFRSKKFKALKEDTDQIYLNDDELKSLYEIDLSSNKRLEKVRDLFLIGCYTGLRFSDLSTLASSNIDLDKKKIKVKTQKTGQIVQIPLNQIVIVILTKYNNMIPQPLSNQKMNAYLKEVGKEADMISVITISKSSGKNVKKELFKKYQLITTHTARRSFATNAYLAKVPVISIMMITGHKTEKAFMRYIRITHEENATIMLDHPHFK